ncbi:MAG: hypothetical protein LBK65_01400 [Tannerellaceae bacterium]|jgi:hypothetical protein|nr:hypothetical protein [Tannerellaceae bacterium]
MTLNESQACRVAAYLRRSGVEDTQLYADLLDHLCCMVEQEMETGRSFDDAMTAVTGELTAVELKTIESFTLKLINMETTFSSRTAAMATIPFVLFGISWVLTDSGLALPSFIRLLMISAPILSMFVLLGIGWMYNFPRWSVPAIGFCTLFSLFLMMIRIPAISDERLGAWAFIPILATGVICCIGHPSFKPVKHLIRKIKDEPALILFTFYGFAPMFAWFFMDETHSLWNIPVAAASTAVLASGLYLFLKSERKKARLASVICSAAAAALIAFTAAHLHWACM